MVRNKNLTISYPYANIEQGAKMANKSRAKKSKKIINPNQNDILHLERLIKASENAIDGTSESLDELFQRQVNKLKEELKLLKKSK